MDEQQKAMIEANRAKRRAALRQKLLRVHQAGIITADEGREVVEMAKNDGLLVGCEWMVADWLALAAGNDAMRGAGKAD